MIRTLTFYIDVLDIFNYIERNDYFAQSLSTSDRTCTDEIRCHCFTMDTGYCMRINTVPMFMESNRLVSTTSLVHLWFSYDHFNNICNKMCSLDSKNFANIIHEERTRTSAGER